MSVLTNRIPLAFFAYNCPRHTMILPGAPRNLGLRVLSLCMRRLVCDWPARFGHEVLLAETFVDLARFRGTVYRAAN